MCRVTPINAYLQIKKQKENINGLQDTVKKYENDLNEIKIKAEQVELELKDSKLKYTQQVRWNKYKNRK